MATMAASLPTANNSLPSTLTMSSSHSSEGSNISFVLLDKSSLDEHSQLSLNSEDGKVLTKNESSTEAGSAMDQHELVERVQNLTKENEELKRVLFENNKLLETYFQDLANAMQKSQKDTKEFLRKGYDQAKEVVKKLRERNACLKTELRNEQNKNLQLEEQMAKLTDTKLNEPSAESDDHSQPEHDDTDHKPRQFQSLKEEIKRLEDEKLTLETNNSKLQEHIECLRVMKEADTSIGTEEFETLVSLDSLPALPSDHVSVEAIQEKYNKLETEKEILVVDLDRMKIENEQKQQQYQKMEEEYNILIKKLADMEQNEVAKGTGSNLGQLEEITQQLQVQTEVLTRLKEELEAEKIAKETYKRKIEELEQAKESPKTTEAVSQTDQMAQPVRESDGAGDQLKEQLINMKLERDAYKTKLEEFETHLEEAKAYAEVAFGVVENTGIKETYAKLNDQLKVYQNQEKKIQAMENAILKSNQETSELKQQLEKENMALKQQLDKLMQERDLYKTKAEEFQAQSAEEGKQTSADGELGAEEDADLKEKFKKVKNQLWQYQKRESDILNKENAILEKEAAHRKLLEEKEQQLADALNNAEALKQEKQKQEEDAQSVKRQMSETYEHEVLLMKAELEAKNTEVATAKTSEGNLMAQINQLTQEKQNLVTECEMQKAEMSKREQETESLKRQLSESHEQEVLVLKEEIHAKNEAMSIAQTSEEHLKAQVTQLIQENEALKIDLEEQENMYQDHLHKVSEDSENQRQRRDEIIKNLKMQLSNNEGELQRTRAKHVADEREFHKLQSEHQRTVTEYEQLLESYHTTLDTNKEQEKNYVMEKSALQTRLGELTVHLKEEDDHVQKLKEDIRLREDGLSDLRERCYQLQKLQEQFPILEAQLDVYRTDFQVEREAREKQHGEILHLREQLQQLQQENQHLQDEVERLGHFQMEEMQRRHGSFVSGPQDPQQPRGWFDGFTAVLFPRGGPEMSENPRNPEVHMQAGEQTPGRGQIGGHQQVPCPGGGQEEDWTCPTCARNFPDFQRLQTHAVECIGAPPQATQERQCPKCMQVLPDFDTLAIHVEDCLDQD